MSKKAAKAIGCGLIWTAIFSFLIGPFAIFLGAGIGLLIYADAI